MMVPNSGSEALSTWESVAKDLTLQGGYALLPIPEEQQRIIAKGFQCGRQAFDSIYNHNSNKNAAPATEPSSSPSPSFLVRCIAPTDDSAHATGYHPAASTNSMSRYNAHREGFVFSDGDVFPIVEDAGDHDDFESCMRELQDCLHGIANQVVTALEHELEVPLGWFQDNFHHDGDYSQWHLKRYVVGKDPVVSSSSSPGTNKEAAEKQNEIFNNHNHVVGTTTTEERILLPSHTDPSLLSVVILDQPGQHAGAMGLQLYHTAPGGEEVEKRVWTELPCHGHAVAIVFAGSVWSYITGGKCPSAKHRVVEVNQEAGQDYNKSTVERMAATFFLRPKGSAILQVPPSPALRDVRLKKKTDFNAWSSRVSRNYMKRKNQKKGVEAERKGDAK